MLTTKQRNIGESALSQKPKKPLALVLKNGAVTLDKLSPEVIDLINEGGAVSLEDYLALLHRVQDLEEIVKNWKPVEPEEPDEDATGYVVMTEHPTEENLSQVVSNKTVKPTGAQELDMTSLNKPTLMYLAFPITWEIVENGLITSPVILDSNGYEQGMFYDEDDPYIEVKGVVYRIMDVELGKERYTIEFK